MRTSFPVLGNLPKPLLAIIVIAVSLGGLFMANAQRMPIPFTVIEEGNTVKTTDVEQVVINDNLTLSRIWTRDFPCLPTWCVSFPRVNFTTETVLAVFLGPHSPGYKLEITRVSQAGQLDPHIIVDMKLSASGCLEPQFLVYWSQMVVIEKTKLPVVFAITQNVTEAC